MISSLFVTLVGILGETLALSCLEGKVEEKQEFPFRGNRGVFRAVENCLPSNELPYLYCAKMFMESAEVEYLCLSSSHDLFSAAEDEELVRGGICTHVQKGSVQFPGQENRWKWMCFCRENFCNSPEFGAKFSPKTSHKFAELWIGVSLGIVGISIAALVAACNFSGGTGKQSATIILQNTL